MNPPENLKKTETRNAQDNIQEKTMSALPAGSAWTKTTAVQMTWSNGMRTIFRMSYEIVRSCK